MRAMQKFQAEQYVGCSQNYGPFWFIDYLGVPIFWKWNLKTQNPKCGNYPCAWQQIHALRTRMTNGLRERPGDVEDLIMGFEP